MKPHTRCFFGFSLLLIILVGTGCGSPVPIEEPSETVFVPDLVGKWQTMPLPGDLAQEVVVLNFNDAEYYVELRERKRGGEPGDTLRLRAYVTHIDGRPFINAQYIDSMDDDDRVFFFYAFDLVPDGSLLLTELTDVGEARIDKFETSEALLAFIRENLHNADLYGESMALTKIAG